MATLRKLRGFKWNGSFYPKLSNFLLVIQSYNLCFFSQVSLDFTQQCVGCFGALGLYVDFFGGGVERHTCLDSVSM